MAAATAMGEGNEVPFVDAHARSGFKIRADKQWSLRVFLQLVGQCGGRINLAAFDAERAALRAENQSAHVIIFDLVEQLFVVRAFGGSENAEIVRHQHLAELFRAVSFS